MSPIRLQELPPQNSSLPLKLFFLKNLGSSRYPEYRQLLRQHLFDALSQEGLNPSADLLDTKKRPEHPELNISLSHGPEHSLLAWIPKTHQVGVDIEALDRLSDKIIERVASSAEVAKSPQSSYLWSAKEAAFKALFPAFNVVSSVEIIDWTELSPQRWTFAVALKNNSNGYGELCLIERHSIAFFTLPS
jgi:4'-phosphopantetheinyl transferase EntD